MAKAEPEVKAPAYVNANGADLILPSGEIIPPGGYIAMSDDLAANLGVQMWIADGLLKSAEQ